MNIVLKSSIMFPESLSPRVGSVAITISPGSYQHFSIFVVELMEGNKAMYKPCSKFEGRFQASEKN